MKNIQRRGIVFRVRKNYDIVCIDDNTDMREVCYNYYISKDNEC